MNDHEKLGRSDEWLQLVEETPVDDLITASSDLWQRMDSIESTKIKLRMAEGIIYMQLRAFQRLRLQPCKRCAQESDKRQRRQSSSRAHRYEVPSQPWHRGDTTSKPAAPPSLQHNPFEQALKNIKPK